MRAKPVVRAISCLAAVLGPSSLVCAQLDSNVQWALASHTDFTDRRPLCPLNGEAFDVVFQAARGDLSAARVGVDDNADGSGIVWVNASVVSSVGPYDVWRAALPATTAGVRAYVIELIDGSDRDYLSTSGVTDEQPATSVWWTLNDSTLAHAPLGATPTAGGTVFRVWAPNATSATVRGVFNSWGNTPLTKVGEFFSAFVPGARAGQKYKFFFNNRDWRPDARARALDNNDSYNSIIVDPFAYSWQVPDFTPVPRDRWVVYQLHIGTFAGLNDPLGSFTRPARYREVAARLDHLVDLGVNAVMLNPMNEFPGQLSGGYNTISSFAWESTYGSADDFKFLVDQLHQRGIAVLLDVVWNHFPSNDNYLWNYDGTQIYFDTPVVGTPWGPQADFDRPQVRQYFLDSVEHVLGEYKLDGYRHDAVFEMTGASQAIPGQQLVRGMTERVRRRFADAHVIAEIYDNSAWNTSPGGMNFHGQYHEAYKNAIRDAIAASGLGDPNIGRIAASIDGSGPFVEGESVLNYYELHDEAWSLSGGQRAVKAIDTTAPHDDRYAIGRTKLGNGLTILSRGMPAILMGTEWLEDNGWEQQKIDWSHKNTYAQVFRFYKDLIALRTSEPALFANAALRTTHLNEGANVFAFERHVPGGASFLVVANFSNVDFAEYIVGLPRSGNWGVVLNSEAAEYRGRGVGSQAGCVQVDPVARDGFQQSARLSLPAHGFLILRHEPGFGPPVVERQPESQIACPGGRATFTVQFQSDGVAAISWQRRGQTGGWIDLVDGSVLGLGMVQGATSETLVVDPVSPNLATTALRAVALNSCGVAISSLVQLTPCPVDVDCNGQVDFFDFLAFSERYGEQDASADFNADGQVDFFDYLDFVSAFTTDC